MVSSILSCYGDISTAVREHEEQNRDDLISQSNQISFSADILAPGIVMGTVFSTRPKHNC